MNKLFNGCWILLVAMQAIAASRPCCAASEEATRTVPATATLEPTAESIHRLVVELGSDEYFVRQRAEAELLRIGPDAFDALTAVEDADDLEVASRARYILSHMKIKWVRPDDFPKVQQLMARYGNISLAEREKRIVRLAALADDQGLAALCRIVRYDASPLQSRRAALQIVLEKNAMPNRGARVFALLTHEMGKSRRAPIQWIQTYIDQQEAPKVAVHRWKDWIEAENKRLAQESGETSVALIFSLIENQLQLCDALLEADPEIREVVLATLEHWVDLQAKQEGGDHLGLFQVLNWIRIQEKWNVLSVLENRYEAQLKEHRSLLYLVAATRGRQGRKEESQQIAKRAFQLSANDNDQRNAVANELLSLGHLDWAEREWRYVIDTFPVVDDYSKEARRALASWCLHDRGEDQAAAQLLTDYFEVFDQQQKKQNKGLRVDSAGPLRAQRDYYLACHAQNQKDYAQQKKYLESAVRYYETDPDILIAMYHLEGANERFRAQTKLRIQRVSSRLLVIIEHYPTEANFYNHWAWLISNTEGDFQKAIEFSHRSLELSPNEASYLDTLGRCYHAAGDLENAIKYQRQAVQFNPQLRVMRRQLKRFEKELAEKE